MTQSKGKTKARSKGPGGRSRRAPVSQARSEAQPAAAPARAQPARLVRIDAEGAGQRIDNLLLRELKGVPRSRVYSMLRKGEVRVDGRRIRAGHRLQAGEEVRLPPWHGPAAGRLPAAPSGALVERLEAGILHEDDDLLAMDKPAGLAVHGGSGIHLGLVEALRQLRPGTPFLELAHRIDRDTSGCVLLAKRRAALRRLHVLFRERRAQKRYLALVEGAWPAHLRQLDAPLERRVAASGERFVRVSAAGKSAATRVRVASRLQGATLLEVEPETGRTHQIRVHLAAAGHPILGDPKYADDVARGRHQALGVVRLCLHAASIELPEWDNEGAARRFEAPLPSDMADLVARLSG